ncbi:MAG TPA: hypothetical protein VF069_21660 [Streptosporangiaceae bacterium]
MAGYSSTPLPKKLGIKPGNRVLLVDAPAGFGLDPLPADVIADRKPEATSYDVIVAFCPDLAALTDGFAGWRALLAPAGGLWVAWPKKSSGVPTDLTENAVRDIGLAGRLVDNKVCAIDETWSGLRLVIRRTDR